MKKAKYYSLIRILQYARDNAWKPNPKQKYHSYLTCCGRPYEIVGEGNALGDVVYQLHCSKCGKRHVD